MTQPIRPLAKIRLVDRALAARNKQFLSPSSTKPAPFMPAAGPVILNPQGRPVDMQGIEQVSVKQAIVLDSHGDPIKTSTRAIETAPSPTAPISADLDFSRRYFALTALTKPTTGESLAYGPFKIGARYTKDQELRELANALSLYLPGPLRNLATRISESKIADIREYAMIGGQIGAGIACLGAGYPAAAILFFWVASSMINRAKYALTSFPNTRKGGRVTQLPREVTQQATFSAAKTKSLPPKQANKLIRQGPPRPGKAIREAVQERRQREASFQQRKR